METVGADWVLVKMKEGRIKFGIYRSIIVLCLSDVSVWYLSIYNCIMSIRCVYIQMNLDPYRPCRIRFQLNLNKCFKLVWRRRKNKFIMNVYLIYQIPTCSTFLRNTNLLYLLEKWIIIRSWRDRIIQTS